MKREKTEYLLFGFIIGLLFLIPSMGIVLFCYVELHFGDRRKNWADQYTVRCGYGTELCTYLDMVGVEDIPYPYRFLEIKKISNDERIAILQKSGVEYFNSDKQ